MKLHEAMGYTNEQLDYAYNKFMRFMITQIKPGDTYADTARLLMEHIKSTRDEDVLLIMVLSTIAGLIKVWEENECLCARNEIKH